MDYKKFLFGLFSIPFLAGKVSAHCPLCTVGVGAAAGGAALLGVSTAVIALFVGAFAVSTGWWVARSINKKYIPFQTTLIITASFLLTVLPLLPIIGASHPYYFSLFGPYGSLFNKTYMVNTSVITGVVGGIIVLLSPKLSKRITKIRGRKIVPFQGVIITLLALLVAGALTYLIV